MGWGEARRVERDGVRHEALRMRRQTCSQVTSLVGLSVRLATSRRAPAICAITPAPTKASTPLGVYSISTVLAAALCARHSVTLSGYAMADTGEW